MDGSNFDATHPLKRRRTSISTSQRKITRYSSPDELAGDSSDQPGSGRPKHIRQRGLAQATTTPQQQVHKEGHSEFRRRSYYDDAVSINDESPDELDDSVHTFYRHSGSGARSRHSSGREYSLAASSEDETKSEKERHKNTGTAEDSSENEREMETPRSRLSQEPMEDESVSGGKEVDETPRHVPFRPYEGKTILRGHRKGVSAVKFSPDGAVIASCSADATIIIWDLSSGRLLHTLEAHLSGISTIAWSPDSKVLASGSDDKSIRLWNVAKGEPYAVPLLGHHNYVYSLAFSPKGNMIVSGSYDEAVFLWDVRGARVMRSLPAHSDPVGGVDFVRDGTLITSCGGDGLIRVWDTATGQCLRTLVHEDNAPVTSVKFSPNGKFILAWTLDSSVRLWDYVEGRCLKTYQGHKNVKYSIAGTIGVYGDGKQAFVGSGSENGQILLWDVKSKAILQCLEAHQGVVLGLDTYGDLLVSGGVDGTVRIWQVERNTRQVE